MQSHTILAVHGFLGSGSDWQLVQSNVSNCHWITPNLFFSDADYSLKNAVSVCANELSSFDLLADRLMQMMQNLDQSTEQKIFVGYSLGARIGLHILERYADQFKKFIFISGHPGLLTEADKQARKTNDLNWTTKLENLSLSEFFFEWNKQSVFQNSTVYAERDLNRFDSQKLIYGLTSLSLANQGNKNDLLRKYSEKIVWVVGDQDHKFLAIADELKQKKILSSYERIFNSGHRVLFDQPSKVADIIKSNIN